MEIPHDCFLLALLLAVRAAKEAIPRLAQQLRRSAPPDMITLGSLSLQQVSATKGKYLCHHPTFTAASAMSIMQVCPSLMEREWVAHACGLSVVLCRGAQKVLCFFVFLYLLLPPFFS